MADQPSTWIKEAEAAIPKLNDGWYAYATNPNTYAGLLACIVLFPIFLSTLGGRKAGRGGSLIGLFLGTVAMVLPALIMAMLFLINYEVWAWRRAPAQTRLQPPDQANG